MRWLINLLVVQGRHFLDRLEAEGRATRTDEEEAVAIIVDGLLLEDKGEDGLVERWCMANREFFHICTCKGAPPSLSIPFSLVQQVRFDGRDTVDVLTRKQDSNANINPSLQADLLNPRIIRKQTIKQNVMKRWAGGDGLQQAFDTWRRNARDPRAGSPPPSVEKQDDNGGQVILGGGSGSAAGAWAARGTAAVTATQADGHEGSDDEDGTMDLDKGAFTIVTKESRFKASQEFTFLSANSDVCQWWIEGVQAAIEYHQTLPELTHWQMLRKNVEMSYHSDTFQVGVALMIFLNFIVQAVEAQVLPESGTSTNGLFKSLEIAFLVIFCIELGINMFATLFLPFFSSGWNWFDMVVIATSIWTTSGDVGAGTGVLRLLRAGKVVRLFTRLPSLRKIMVALYESIPAMINAMFLTGIVMCMYGVMGVSFFKEHDNFKAFDVAVFTLFQASTGDGWSDIVRDLYLPGNSNSWTNALISLYFISYMIIVGFILMQVVIAVLLDEFAKVSEAESYDELQSERVAGSQFTLRPNPFEAFVEAFTLCRDVDSQNFKISRMFGDVAAVSGKTTHDSLTFKEVASGLRALKVLPPSFAFV